MPASMFLSTAGLRVVCAWMGAQVVVLPAIVALVARSAAERPAPPPWLGAARLLAAALTIYLCLMPPLFVRHTPRMSARMRERGVEPDRLHALLGLVGYGPPVDYGTLLFMLGDDARIAYGAALLSALGLAYWVSRYRHVFWPADGAAA